MLRRRPFFCIHIFLTPSSVLNYPSSGTTFRLSAMVGAVLPAICGRNGFRSIARIAAFVFFMSLIGTAHATEPDMSASIRQPHEAHLQSSSNAADTLAAAIWLISRTYSTANPNRNAPSSRHFPTDIWTTSQECLLKTTLWSLCISLMIVSCVVEQESSPMRIWL